LSAHLVVIDDDNSDSDSIHSSHDVINRDDVPAVEHALTPAADSDNNPVSSTPVANSDDKSVDVTQVSCNFILPPFFS
jgi:hypothetical protein